MNSVIESKMLQMIDQITDKAADRLSACVIRRLADLRHVVVAGGTLTTCERSEVQELWTRYAQ